MEKKAYTATGKAAILCGAATMVLGAVTAVFFRTERTIAVGLLCVTAVNAALHMACYLRSLKTRPLGNTLTIMFVEIFVCAIFCVERTWHTLAAVYGTYLVMNGASLAAIPLRRSRIFGVVAIASGIATWLQPILLPNMMPLVVGIGLIINGGERFVMAIKST